MLPSEGKAIPSLMGLRREVFMNWNQDKSISLSMICVCLFGAVLLCSDIAAIYLLFSMLLGSLPSGIAENSRFFTEGRLYALFAFWLLFSLPAWTALWQLRRILLNFRRNLVFEPDTVRCMRIASWCCVAAALILFAAGFVFPTMFVLALASAFMALIVRIVKNSFEAAIRMKDELDLTI